MACIVNYNIIFYIYGFMGSPYDKGRKGDDIY